MENHNNLTELRRAEQSTEAEEQYRSMSGEDIHPARDHPFGNGNIILHNQIGGSNLHEPRMTRSSPPVSTAAKDGSEDSNSGGESDNDKDEHDNDDDDDDEKSVNDSHKFKNQHDQDDANLAGDTSNTKGSVSKFSFQPQPSLVDGISSTAHRESSLLLQIVPYRPRTLHQVNSDRLIPYRQETENDIKHLTQGATNSVRLLLEKWTNSGSAPVANILNEEAAKEKSELSVGVSHRLIELR